MARGGFLGLVRRLVPARAFREVRSIYFDDEAAPKARITVARSTTLRVFGLLGLEALDFGEGMLFIGEDGVHTHGMAFPLDLLFLRAAEAHEELHFSVTYAEEFVPPGTVRKVPGATAVIEFAGGALRRFGEQVPKTVRLSPPLPCDANQLPVQGI